MEYRYLGKSGLYASRICVGGVQLGSDDLSQSQVDQIIGTMFDVQKGHRDISIAVTEGIVAVDRAQATNQPPGTQASTPIQLGVGEQVQPVEDPPAVHPP